VPPAALAPAPAPAPMESNRQLKDLLAATLELAVAARLERFPLLADEARGLAQTARDARGADAWTRLASQLRQFFFKIEVRGETDAELLDALLRLLGLLVNNIAELVEDDKWLSGQVAVIREVINEPLTTERIGEAERRFKEVVYKQSMLKHSLREAKSTLKDLIGLFVTRLSELTESTTEYHQRVEGYAGRLEGADDIQTLKTIVDELMSDTRSMQVDMTRYHDEMVEARRQAEYAEGRVRKLEVELEHVSEQVSQDQLTGALNRRGLDEAMQREIARAERRKSGLCVAVLDLDDFKKLNDTHGHQAGDDALVHLTKVVRKTLRPTDTVARYGGEEFIILFSETDLEQAVSVVRRLQRELTKRFFLHNNERLLITFSAGVAMLAPGESQEAVFARADKAMYQAKVQGKNRVVSAE
jgi:diguanylate cyclase